MSREAIIATENDGIVFIDEIDKIVSNSDSRSGENRRGSGGGQASIVFIDEIDKIVSNFESRVFFMLVFSCRIFPILSD